MPRVLIVDDQPAFRAQLRRLLQRVGMDVVGEAGDIPAAEAQVAALQPDLAVVDVMLPGVNGLDGAPRLKALLPGLRVILISAYADRADAFRRAAREAGAEAFIAKDDLDLRLVQTWKKEIAHMSTPSSIRDVIVAADLQWMAAFGRGATAAVAQLYTEDGQVLPPGSEPLAGRAAIQAFWQGVMKMGVKTITLETSEAVQCGDGVYEVGRYVLMGANGQPLDRGKYLEIWQRHGQSWLIHRDIWNTSQTA